MFKLKSLEFPFTPPSVFVILVLKHAEIFLKKMITYYGVATKSVYMRLDSKDLNTVSRSGFSDFQPLTLEDVQKNKRKNKIKFIVTLQEHSDSHLISVTPVFLTPINSFDSTFKVQLQYDHFLPSLLLAHRSKLPPSLAWIALSFNMSPLHSSLTTTCN
jgi:hypothetical protein